MRAVGSILGVGVVIWGGAGCARRESPAFVHRGSEGVTGLRGEWGRAYRDPGDRGCEKPVIKILNLEMQKKEKEKKKFKGTNRS